MAFLDNPTIILAHIRQSHVTSDDTGMCEMVLIDHDVDLEKFNPSSAYGDSGSETQGSNGETQGYVYSQSVDITSSWDFGIRRRSNTAQRLERLRKERQNQIKCKNVQWKDRNTSYSVPEILCFSLAGTNNTGGGSQEEEEPQRAVPSSSSRGLFCFWSVALLENMYESSNSSDSCSRMGEFGCPLLTVQLSHGRGPASGGPLVKEKAAGWCCLPRAAPTAPPPETTPQRSSHKHFCSPARRYVVVI